MKFFKLRAVSIFLSTLAFAVMSMSTVFAASGDAEVDVLVRGESTIGVPNATVTVYVRNEITHDYFQYEGEYITNSSGRVNGVQVPHGATFYAFAVDAEGNEYAGSGFSFDNIWYVQGDGSVKNVDTGSVRGPAAVYVHLYPGYNSVTAATDPGPLDEPVSSPDTSVSSDDEDEVSPIVGAEDFEVEVTVYNVYRDPIVGAQVTLYVVGHGAYSTGTTDGAGRTSEIIAPMGYDFYAKAVDGTELTYGGTYDYYYDRQNIWRGGDGGESISNTSTGTTRLPYLHLYPEEFLPAVAMDDSGASAEFDAETYLCGAFPDAVYADITPEECTAIEYVKDEAIFTGTAEGFLELNRPINRAEVTKVMLEAFDYYTGTPPTYSRLFPDVPKVGEWFSDYVYNALANSIVGGYPDGFFRPAQTINRVELLRIFIEASNVSYADIPTTFTFWHDVKVDAGTQWFIGYANFAFYNELLENDGNLLPAQPMTRMDVIKLLYRASLISE